MKINYTINPGIEVSNGELRVGDYFEYTKDKGNAYKVSAIDRKGGMLKYYRKDNKPSNFCVLSEEYLKLIKKIELEDLHLYTIKYN